MSFDKGILSVEHTNEPSMGKNDSAFFHLEDHWSDCYSSLQNVSSFRYKLYSWLQSLWTAHTCFRRIQRVAMKISLCELN
jgi:hypothetical protein